MDTKKMLAEGFRKVQVAVVIHKDINGKEHIYVVDTADNAKMYKGSDELRLATMFVRDN